MAGCSRRAIDRSNGRAFALHAFSSRLPATTSRMAAIRSLRFHTGAFAGNDLPRLRTSFAFSDFLFMGCEELRHVLRPHVHPPACRFGPTERIRTCCRLVFLPVATATCAHQAPKCSRIRSLATEYASNGWIPPVGTAFAFYTIGGRQIDRLDLKIIVVYLRDGRLHASNQDDRICQ